MSFDKARDFVLSNGRILERRLFHFHFTAGPREGVLHAVLAYQNPDGGFGHGLEPDTSSPESQPLFTQMALEILDEIDCFDEPIIDRHHVARCAVVLRRQPLRTEQLGVDRAEHFLARVVELIQSGAKLVALSREPVADNLVGPTLELDLGTRFRRRLVLRCFCHGGYL